MKKKSGLIFFLFVCPLLGQNTSTLNFNYSVGITENEPLIYKNRLSSENDSYTGILFDVWTESISQLNVSFTYASFNLSNKTELAQFDIILFQAADSTSDESRVVSQIDEAFLGNYWKSTEIIKETYYMFFPSMLAILIQGVIWELFFFVVIIMMPWILIHAQILYVFDSRNFRNLSYYRGIMKSIRRMLGKDKSSKTRCGQIYPYIFYATTSLIMMLILGDFIYIIANMLTKYDISNVYDIVNNKVNICTYKGDFFVTSNLKQFREIFLIEKNDIQDCFKQLSNLESHAFLVSEYYVRHFFRIEDNQKYNNRFGYSLKQNSFKKYQFLFKKTMNSDVIKMLNENITQLRNKDEFESILKEYLEYIRYDKLPASSILSDSTILIFSSLTITSIFMIAFLIFTIKSRLRKGRIKEKLTNLKLIKGGVAETSQAKAGQNGICTVSNQLIDKQVLNLHQFGQPDTSQRNTQGRKMKGTAQDHKIIQESKRHVPGNRSLSLTGPIINFKYDGRPLPSWVDAGEHRDSSKLEIDIEKPISSVSRMNSEAHHASELSVFDQGSENF